MATSYIFDSKRISIPGAYSTIKSGIKNPAVDLGFGNCLVIDTGSGAGWGGGSGIAGELANGLDAIYTFNNTQDFGNFVNGGLWWYAAKPLFFPGGGANQGVGTLTYIRACATTAPSFTWTFTGGGANGGTVIVKSKTEGIAGNGILGDETSATGVITVTGAGATSASITVLIAGVIVATYTNLASDSIATMVSGLVASAKALDLVKVTSSNATTLTITNLVGRGATATTATIQVTGAATATAAPHSGGVDGTKVTRGFGSKMRAGTKDVNKFAIDFYKGTYRGRDTAVALDYSSDFDGVAENLTNPYIVCTSDEFASVAALATWMQNSTKFQEFFTFVSATPTGTGVVTTPDMTTYSAAKVFAGGTETYNSTNIDTALANLVDVPFDTIICDKWGANAQNANNIKIQGWVATTAQTKADIYIGGGKDSSKWTQALGSIPDAQFFNDQNVSIVHSAIKIPDSTRGTGFRYYDSIIHACFVAGRECGIEPQVPLTFKSVGIGGLVHNLTTAEVEAGLEAGVLMTKKRGTTFDIVKGLNSLQTNLNLVNPDGSTSSKQMRRIIRQINKELVYNANKDLLKSPSGVNRNTLSAAALKSWVEAYLKNKTATTTNDDLILSFGNVVVTVVGDSYNVTYEIVPNFEVSFVFMTGFLLDPSSK